MAVPAQPATLPTRRRPLTWGWLVAVSACLVLGSIVALIVWWAITGQRSVTTYSVRGTVSAIVLDLGSADAQIVGGGDEPAVEVRRTDEFAFGRRAEAQRQATEGVLSIRSRCPATVLGACAASYRLTVPDNVPVTVRTTTGNVRFSDYRGSAQVDTGTGDIQVAAFCGFALRATAQTGNVTAATACAPERLELRSRTGDVRAVVPPGRYQVDADSDDGERSVRGVTEAADAPYQIQALSSVGDVEVATSG